MLKLKVFIQTDILIKIANIFCADSSFINLFYTRIHSFLYLRPAFANTPLLILMFSKITSSTFSLKGKPYGILSSNRKKQNGSIYQQARFLAAIWNKFSLPFGKNISLHRIDNYFIKPTTDFASTHQSCSQNIYNLCVVELAPLS